MDTEDYGIQQRHEQLVIVHRPCDDTVTIVENGDTMTVLLAMISGHDDRCDV